MLKSQIISILDKYPLIALAVSGGADSMAMAEWFRQNRPAGSFMILNIDHHIRGEESKRDSDFVESYAKKYSIDYRHYDVYALEYAKQNGMTIEQAARVLRHKIFETAAAEYAYAVATAHHMQDQVESIFMHIARGTGIDGLVGMAVEDGYLLRPLLYTSKEDILQYIQQNKIEYCEDSTNFENEYSRNYVRNQVVPMIEKKFPSFGKSLLKLSERAKEIADFVDQNTPTLYVQEGGVYCDFECKHKVIKAEMIRRAFFLLGISADIEERHIDSIIQFCDSSSSGSLDMPYSTIAFKERNGVVIAKKMIFQRKIYRFSEGIFEIGGFELQVEKIENSKSFDIKEQSGLDIYKSLFIALDNLADVTIRFRENGDKIEKFGGGSKSLGDFLTDKKVPLRLKDRLPIIADNDGVLCVCGVDISKRAKVFEQSTNIYKITLRCMD